MADFFFANRDADRAYRDRLQTLLRRGDADEADRIVRENLTILANRGEALAGRCLSTSLDEVRIVGWQRLNARCEALDHPEKPITAIGVDLSWPGHTDRQVDASGAMNPLIETNFFSDAAFPFSSSDRSALLTGYGISSSKWQGSFEDIDDTIGVEGIGDLYGPIYQLKQQHRAAPSREFDVAVIGSCFVAVSIHRAVRAAIEKQGLPRPLTVFVGSNESYPFFDAPVCSHEEAMKFVRDFSESNIDDIALERIDLQHDKNAQAVQMVIAEQTAILQKALPLLNSMDKATRGRAIGEALSALFTVNDRLGYYSTED